MNRLPILILASFFLLSSGIAWGQDDERKKQDKERKYEEGDKPRDKSEGKIFPFSSLGIPKGHLPPPGECKIWIPGLPAGQQGPPQSCRSAFRDVPLGAWVITHTGSRYKVNILSKERPSIVIGVRLYALP